MSLLILILMRLFVTFSMIVHDWMDLVSYRGLIGSDASAYFLKYVLGVWVYVVSRLSNPVSKLEIWKKKYLKKIEHSMMLGQI